MRPASNNADRLGDKVVKGIAREGGRMMVLAMCRSACRRRYLFTNGYCSARIVACDIISTLIMNRVRAPDKIF